MSNSKLIIYFIKRIKRKSYYSSIQILGEKYKIGNKDLIIEIEDKYFNDWKEKIIIELQINPLDILSEPLKYKMNIFYGINTAYCFLTEETNLLIEYNFIDAQQIFYQDIELKEYDGNGLVKRLVLINCPHLLNISNKYLTFLNSILNFSDNLKFNSFELTDCDFNKLFFGVRVIQAEEKFSIIENMNEQKQKLQKFFADLKILIEKNINDKNIYLNLYNNYNIKEYNFNFSQRRKLLENEFKTNDDYYVMHLYWIWYSIKYSYLYKSKNYECNISIINIFNNMNKFYNIYLKDEELKVYQKILLFYSHVTFFLEKNDIKKYESSNLKYIKRKDIKDGSIYKHGFDFMKNFISKLNEKSYLFFPLLMLDCGNYYFNVDKEYIYGYNRESCDVIKSHLEEIIPDIFFEYNETISPVKEEKGFNYKGFGIIFLNCLSIFKNLDKDLLNKAYNDEKQKRIFKHYGMLASKTLIHESFCHIKMTFDKKDRTISPSKFFNTKKKLVKMIPILSYKNKEEDIEYFKSLNEKCTGESGKFFEYFFGKYDENKLIIDLIYKIDYVGNLFDNVDYFVKENLNDLQKYLINKYLLNKSKSITYDDTNLSFEDENKKMEQIILSQEKIKKINNKDEIKESEKNEEEIKNISESKKDIIFYEEDSNDAEGKTDTIKKIEEKDEDPLPFFISLHKS